MAGAGAHTHGGTVRPTSSKNERQPGDRVSGALYFATATSASRRDLTRTGSVPARLCACAGLVQVPLETEGANCSSRGTILAFKGPAASFLRTQTHNRAKRHGQRLQLHTPEVCLSVCYLVGV